MSKSKYPVVIAAFDMDGTITKGDSFWRYLIYVSSLKKVVITCLKNPLLIVLGLLYPTRFAQRAKSFLIRKILRDYQVDQLNEKSENFVRCTLLNRLNQFSVERIKWHQAQGHSVVIITASLNSYVSYLANCLGIKDYLATELEIRDGRVTGNLQTPNNRGPEKRERLFEWIKNNVKPADNSEIFIYAYGNSKNDREMLRAADIAIRVDKIR